MNVIDEYIQEFPLEKQIRLKEIREIIKESSPQATEKISWAMPTFYLNGNLVHFAQQKNHIGFYPGESGVSSFEDKIQGYKHSKGAIQFPDNRPLPKELIQEIVRFRTQEQLNQ
ncbi:MAG: DUF1801 domain-containing protein [Coprobacillus sp.]